MSKTAEEIIAEALKGLDEAELDSRRRVEVATQAFVAAHFQLQEVLTKAFVVQGLLRVGEDVTKFLTSSLFVVAGKTTEQVFTQLLMDGLPEHAVEEGIEAIVNDISEHVTEGGAMAKRVAKDPERFGYALWGGPHG